MDTGTERAAAAEIAEHHRFIEAWLRGTADPGRLGEFVAMHTPDFTLCGPDGGVLDRDAVASGFGGGHGAAPGIGVRIRGARLVAEEGDLVVAAYEEHQEAPSSVRRSTVVFARDPGARNGLRWKHLHETWIAPPQG
ncbi:DUF4440 domain-containing protein [Nocardiopsis potens]|uniref:DUF4440 domain-containing protein n=1 Tax=Nocardiopsis potens TaxID=1246458 RepID=UPI00034A8AF6|nr:DUF4440 domain-containing protein [Nocardiopsis potens]